MGEARMRLLLLIPHLTWVPFIALIDETSHVAKINIFADEFGMKNGSVRNYKLPTN
jgi:hypothetical protein